MGQDTQARKPFLRSLLHDRTANTLAISAAAIFPILAMVGGGVDASRYYMAASRLQAACDAGALAARRAMINDDFLDEHRTIAQNFFDQNYEDNMFGSKSRVRQFDTNGNGRVDGVASAVLPTSIMSIFGFDELDLSVSCSADINISNSDIMFVLDVTGSMNCPETQIVNCPGNGNNNNTEVANSLIVGLREAVMGFYDTVEESTSANAQVRFGAVPYSSNVNVGFQIPRQFLADTHSYQSRVARFRENIEVIPGNGVEVGDEIVVSDQVERLPRLTSNFGSTNLDHYRFGNNRNNGTAVTNQAEFNRCNAMSGITHTVGNQRWEILSDTYVLNAFSNGSQTNRAGCNGRIRKTRTATPADVIEDQTIRTIVSDGYTYCRVTPGVANNCSVTNPAGSPAGWETVDFRTLYDDNQIQLPTGDNGVMETHTWGGCIEEADTVRGPTFSPRPADAFDLDINLVPANQAQQWKPSLERAVFRRFFNLFSETGADRDPVGDPTTGNYACPVQAFTLQDIGRAELQAYVDGLRARGNTYHDIGMIWGARFISPNGMFRANNETAPNGDGIARHIVFMTDGLLVPSVVQYGTYGFEQLDRRVTDNGQNAQAAERHAARFQAACAAARRENITVWVVAFGIELSQNLLDCATEGRAFQAGNNAELQEQFRRIAQQIAALRLTS